MNHKIVPLLVGYVCKTCKYAYYVAEQDPHMYLLRKTMRCPNFGACESKIKAYVAPQKIILKGAQKISALTLFQACMGAGLPHEKKCGPKDIRKIMAGATIVEVELEESPDPKRSIIKSLTLNSGKVLHLSSSTKGATIYKVTEQLNG